MAERELQYQSGFGNEFATEAVEGGLPVVEITFRTAAAEPSRP